MMIAPCPRCKRSDYKSYGNSRTIGSDGLYAQYLRCSHCDHKYRATRSRDFRNLEGWPRPRTGEPVIISPHLMDSPGFLITDAAAHDNRYRVADIAIAEGRLKSERATALPPAATVILSALQYDEKAPLQRGWGYVETLNAPDYWPLTASHPLRAGPHMALGISIAQYYGSPAILMNTKGLRKAAEWRDYFQSLLKVDPDYHIQFIDSPDVESCYLTLRAEYGII